MTAILDDQAADTRALVDAAKAGDRDAYAALYTQYQPQVWRYIRYRVRDGETTEDLTQDVFRRAFTRIASFEHHPGKDVGAWFITIARNLIADHYKSAYVRLQVGTATDWLDKFDLADEDQWVDPDLSAERSLVRKALVAAVGRLNSEQRRCVQLRFLRGLTVAETAAAMGKGEGAVKALQYRATRALQRDPAVEALR